MTNKTFPQLPVAATLDGTEITALVQSGVSVQSTVSAMASPGSRNIGYLNVPQNSHSADYTTVLADSGKHIYHPASSGAGDTFTIASNAAVPYAIGTVLTFVNRDAANSVAIAIDADTLLWTSGGATGTRTLTSFGIATALKIDTTEWLINGTGLT